MSPQLVAIAKAILFILRHMPNAPMGQIAKHRQAMIDITGERDW